MNDSDTEVIRLITPDSGEWPKELNDLERPPTQLWVRGTGYLSDMVRKSVSIIGSRLCTSYGHSVATDIAYGLSARNWTVISGGAFGIDAAAHNGAMSIPYGARSTIAVMPCGVDRFYPPSHSGMFETILRNRGLLISEYAPGVDAYRERFLERNRIIAALGRGMVLVEATERSGSRAAFRNARELGRKLMVVPGPITSEHSRGTFLELCERDTVPVSTFSDVITELER